MSAIFRTVTLQWDGKTYDVKPTMQLLNKIEHQVSLAVLLNKYRDNAPQISHLAFVLGEFLRSAGAKVSDEEVYQELVTTDDTGYFMSVWGAIFEAVIPAPKKKGDSLAVQQ